MWLLISCDIEKTQLTNSGLYDDPRKINHFLRFRACQINSAAKCASLRTSRRCCNYCSNSSTYLCDDSRHRRYVAGVPGHGHADLCCLRRSDLPQEADRLRQCDPRNPLNRRCQCFHTGIVFVGSIKTALRLQNAEFPGIWTTPCFGRLR